MGSEEPGGRDRRLRYVACVSYPRSGHHVTQRVLQAYFGETFRHCEFYRTPPGECCKSFPCRDPTVTMSKCHDFGLCGLFGRGVRPPRSTRCLVLVRSFLDAAVSEYEMTRRDAPQLPDTAASWKRFAWERTGYYRRFVSKWASGGDGDHRRLIRYEDLTASPYDVLGGVVGWIDPSKPPDGERLGACIEGVSALEVHEGQAVFVAGRGVQSRRDLNRCRWFDPGLFADLERTLAGVLRGLGYPMRFMGNA